MRVNEIYSLISMYVMLISKQNRPDKAHEQSSGRKTSNNNNCKRKFQGSKIYFKVVANIAATPLLSIDKVKECNSLTTAN